MATKRKREIKAWVKESRAKQSTLPKPSLLVRCTYHGKVIVPPSKTPSKTKYVFEPGQSQSVLIEDIPALLDLHTPGGGCCGGSHGEPVYYFSEV